jgi:alkylation response protein AidB-like acyl-CoA dehydrogenase
VGVELELSEDQEFFRATTRKFLAAECPVATVRTLESDPAGFDPEYWRRSTALGWTSMLVPEADGGGSLSEHGLLDLVLVAEEMGRLVAPGPLVPVNVVAAALGRAGTAEQRADVLPGLLAGEALAAWCGPAPVAAEATPDGFVLTGTATPVEAGAQAQHVLVTARSGDQLSQLLVPAGSPGLRVEPLGGLDLVRRFAAVHFDGVVVPESAVVGVAGEAADDVEAQLQLACVLQCAESIGAMDQMFELTLEYLGDRYSFGRPLSSYQALKHRVADNKVWLEASHAIASAAARAVATGSADAAELVSAAKAWIGPHATELMQDCIQLHGGIGVTWEHDLHLYLRRTTVNRVTYGTPKDHAARIAERVLRFRRSPATQAARAAPPLAQRRLHDLGESTAGDLDVEEFRARARAWLADNMPPATAGTMTDRLEEGRRDVERELQRRLWDGGFAGICFPAEYGGLGLTYEHQLAFTEESLPYDMPFSLNVPTLGILAATLVDFGTHEQKLRHLPAILKGEELWVQFLSEPSGGSDLAGCLTRADRDGDVFVMNGSKIWSSAAFASDYAMCLARTNWDVPKHRGLTMFIVKIHQPGIQVEQIRQVNGSMEFCQEFFDDVPIPASDVVGEVDDGWTIATRLLVHERNAVGGGSPYTSGRSSGHDSTGRDDNLAAIVRLQGRTSDAHARQLVAEAHIRQLVGGQLVRRITQAVATGKMAPPAGSVLKLFSATNVMRRYEIGLELAGEDAVVWPEGDDTAGRQLGELTLWRQGLSLGGGSNEIQRNIISERLLGMPRELAADRDVPYRDVRRGAATTP